MIEIKPRKIINASVSVPGSKSYTHRIFIASALSDGVCTIKNALKSEDTLLTQSALKQMGVRFSNSTPIPPPLPPKGGMRAESSEKEMATSESFDVIYGAKGILKPGKEPIYLANSGTSMRLLTAVAALGHGKTTLTGTPRMYERPIGDLIDSLNQIGVRVRSLNNNGCPPIEVEGGDIKGGTVDIRCGVSSQYLSALLLIAPYTRKGLDIHVVEGPVSKPYIDMTIDVMNRLGVEVQREGYERFQVSGKQVFRAGNYTVEPDASQAGYFWATAAITGASIKVKGIFRDSRQGDVRLAEIFESMGCKISQDPDGIVVSGNPLTAIETDMGDMPDMVPTLSVVAAFAKGTTVIKNVAHLRAKESDRLAAVSTELSKMGIETVLTHDGLMIKGGKPRGAEIDTYNDHRIAMSFAIAGLVVPGIFINNEHCVEKSFPNFWEVLNDLRF